MRLSEALPEYHFRERHSVRVDAPPERALAAARQVTLGELPLARALFRLRGLPGDGTILGALAQEGFAVLADTPTELVVGAVGRPWSPRGGIRAGVEFASFAEPGYARMAMNLLAEDGVLTTETRVELTDERARRAFSRYWLLVRPFSGLIRRLWLRAAKRRAEHIEP